jgi:hypothetical protein
MFVLLISDRTFHVFLLLNNGRFLSSSIKRRLACLFLSCELILNRSVLSLRCADCTLEYWWGSIRTTIQGATLIMYYLYFSIVVHSGRISFYALLTLAFF